MCWFFMLQVQTIFICFVDMLKMVQHFGTLLNQPGGVEMILYRYKIMLHEVVMLQLLDHQVRSDCYGGG
jgi:hypothetical protein